MSLQQGVPQQVLDAEAQVDAELSEMMKGRTSEATPPIAVDEPQKPEPVVEQKPEEPKAPAAEPVKPAPPAMEAEATKPDERQKDAKYWEDRFHATERFPKEKNDRNRRLEDELKRLSAVVETVAKASEERKPAKTEDDDDKLENLYDKSLLDEYDPKFLKGLHGGQKKTVTKIVERLRDEFAKQLEEVKRDIGTTKVESAEAKFWREVDAACPGSSSLQYAPTPEFMSYLDKSIPLTGKTIRQVASEAMATGNAKLVAEVFSEYGKAAAPKTVEPVKTQEKAKVIEAQSMPASSGQGSPSAPKPTYRTQLIDYFYNKHFRPGGCYYGQDAKIAQIEKQIEEALREGRASI